MHDEDWPRLTDRDERAIEAIRRQLDRELGAWGAEESEPGAPAARRAGGRDGSGAVPAPVVLEARFHSVRARPRRDPLLLRVAFGAGAATLAAAIILAFFPGPDIPSTSTEIGAPLVAAPGVLPRREAPPEREVLPAREELRAPRAVAAARSRASRTPAPPPEPPAARSEAPAAPRGESVPSRRPARSPVAERPAGEPSWATPAAVAALRLTEIQSP